MHSLIISVSSTITMSSFNFFWQLQGVEIIVATILLHLISAECQVPFCGKQGDQDGGTGLTTPIVYSIGKASLVKSVLDGREPPVIQTWDIALCYGIDRSTPTSANLARTAEPPRQSKALYSLEADWRH